MNLKLHLLVVQTPKKEFGNAAAVIKRSCRAVIQAFLNASLKEILPTVYHCFYIWERNLHT